METNKKTIIQLVVIAGCFVASGFVLYNGLFKNSGSETSSTVVGALDQVIQSGGEVSDQPSQQILPYGNKLDFDVLEDYGQEYGTVIYPVLNPVLEVGVLENEVIKPPPKPAEIQ